MLLDKKPVKGGGAVCLTLRLEDGENPGTGAGENPKAASGENPEAGLRAEPEEHKLYILADDYLAYSEHLAKNEISERLYALLLERGEVYRAGEDAVSLLSYGDNTRKKLYSKLLLRGHGEAAAKEAVALACRAGYIDEQAQLRDTLLRLANEKLYGRRRVVCELLAKGFDRESVSLALSLRENEIDWEENKKKLLSRRFGSPELPAASAKERDKIRGFLYRYGY